MSVHIAFETPEDKQQDVYDLVRDISKDPDGRLKKGSNEVTKAAERGVAKMVIMAEDVNPGELLAHIPMICKEKEIPFIYVANQAELGKQIWGLDTGRRCASVAIMEHGNNLDSQFKGIKEVCTELSSA